MKGVIAVGLSAAMAAVCHAQTSSHPSIETLTDDPFVAMQQFARCSARFAHAADMGRSAGREAEAEEYAGASRGSRAVAEFFALGAALEEMPTEPTEEQVKAMQERLQARRRQVQTYYELEETRQAAMWDRGKLDEQGFQYCFNLQPTQITLIEQMRREYLLH